MRYDTWKATNPSDEWLGPEPENGDMEISKQLERATAKDLGKRIDNAVEELASTARQLARVSHYLQKDGNAQWTEVARLASNISDTIEKLER